MSHRKHDFIQVETMVFFCHDISIHNVNIYTYICIDIYIYIYHIDRMILVIISLSIFSNKNPAVSRGRLPGHLEREHDAMEIQSLVKLIGSAVQGKKKGASKPSAK